MQGKVVPRKGRANDVLLRLIVCEYGMRSAAADAKVTICSTTITLIEFGHYECQARGDTARTRELGGPE